MRSITDNLPPDLDEEPRPPAQLPTHSVVLAGNPGDPRLHEQRGPGWRRYWFARDNGWTPCQSHDHTTPEAAGDCWSQHGG